MPHTQSALLAGALDHLMRYNLTGCRHSARHAAYLLDRLATEPGLMIDLATLCSRMSEMLAENVLQPAWQHRHR